MFGEARTAHFSSERDYRYLLRIIWDVNLPRMQCIGLNPSTADEYQDDPTLRRVKGFARSWGYGGIEMTNLFAFRATDPRKMMARIRPIGEILAGNNDGLTNSNDLWITQTRKACDFCLCAWGTKGSFMDRDTAVVKLLKPLGDLHCLNLTSGGFPQHPLYVAGKTTPIRFDFPDSI